MAREIYGSPDYRPNFVRGDTGARDRSLSRDATFDRNPFRPLPARQQPRQYRWRTRTVSR